MMSTSSSEGTTGAFLRDERGPIRTCVGCRTRAPKQALVRLALATPSGLAGPGVLPDVVVDLHGELPGRGVHLHPTRACATAAIKRGGLAQALRRSPKLTVDALIDGLADQHRLRAMARLGVAHRMKQLAIGEDAVRASLAGVGPQVELLVIASDASDGELSATQGNNMLVLASVNESSAVANEASGPAFGTKGALGRMFGRDEVAVLGVLDRGIADHVAQAMGVASQLTASQRTEAR